MPSKDPFLRLDDILENIARIERYTADMDARSFAIFYSFFVEHYVSSMTGAVKE